jgi:polysaccharide deacetylase family protein (PEP-CTERM system associated)
VIRNALSVDVEEYYHGMEFERAVPGAARRLPSRVEASVERVLALLGEHGVRGTFFTVGAVAEAHPSMVRKIDGEGHETACHGYRHELVSRQDPVSFREDVRRARGVLEDLTGKPILGYRAPNYSIGSAQRWAYQILAEEGFRYDSSIYPIRHDRYGDPTAPRFPRPLGAATTSGLIEFPIGTIRILGVNFPVGGGGYFRLFPERWIRSAIQRVNRVEKQPVMFYFHPWELDPGQPRVPMPPHHRFRHYVNLSRMPRKLDTLLRHIPFSTAREVLGL